MIKEKFKECIALMERDVEEFEKRYQGKFAEAPHIGFGNCKTRCVNEATLPIITCHPSCIDKCASTCYVLRICTMPRPNCRKCEAENTVLRRIDPNAYYEHFYREAERLNLPIRLSDGGDFENIEEVEACKAAALRHPTVKAISYRQAERETEKEIKVWHCRNCAEHGCGCCSPGDISFNEVGGVDWAVKAERA